MAATSQPADLLQATNELARQTREAFAEFLETFKLDPASNSELGASTASQEDAKEPLYMNMLKIMVDEDSTVLEVDFEHIHQHSPALAAVRACSPPDSSPWLYSTSLPFVDA